MILLAFAMDMRMDKSAAGQFTSSNTVVRSEPRRISKEFLLPQGATVTMTFEDESGTVSMSYTNSEPGYKLVWVEETHLGEPLDVSLFDPKTMIDPFLSMMPFILK